MRRQRRLLLYLGCAWEFIRFFGLFLGTGSVCLGVLHSRPDSIVWLVVLASPQLLMAACFFYLAYNPVQYAAYVPVLRIGKILNLFTLSLLLLLGNWRESVGFARVTLLGLPIPSLELVLVIAFFDLIFLSVLLLCGVDAGTPLNLDSRSSLPEFRETELESPGRD